MRWVSQSAPITCLLLAYRPRCQLDGILLYEICAKQPVHEFRHLIWRRSVRLAVPKIGTQPRKCIKDTCVPFDEKKENTVLLPVCFACAATALSLYDMIDWVALTRYKRQTAVSMFAMKRDPEGLAGTGSAPCQPCVDLVSSRFLLFLQACGVATINSIMSTISIPPPIRFWQCTTGS